MIIDNMTSRVCPECKSTDIVHDPDSGEHFCAICGLVLQETEINEGPEWRAFDSRERESRVRGSMPLDPVQATVIGEPNVDGRGQRLPQAKISLMLRLRKWQRRTRLNGSKERNLVQALSELDGLAGRLHISPIIKEEAVKLYQMALNKDLVRGRSINEITAASLYAACRLTGTPRTLNEISKHSTVPTRDIARCYRFIHNELELDMPNPDPRLRVPRLADTVGASERAQRKAVEILTAAKRAKATSGMHPVGLAAAALYLAGRMYGERITQETIAKASGITEVTIRNRYQKLEEFIEDSNN
jgi:transcription initiation factor TFIIB